MNLGGTLINIGKELVTSWKESLYLLCDKRFWLVVLKAAKETYGILFLKFWWLILFCLGEDLFVRVVFSYVYTLTSEVYLIAYMLSFFIWFFVWSLLGYILFMIVRSSLERKSYSYFFRNGKAYSWFVIFTGFIWLLRSFFTSRATFFSKFFVSIFFFIPYYGIYSQLIISTIYFLPYMIFYTFFYLDSSKTIFQFMRRLWSACVMVLHTYPICVASSLFFLAWAYGVQVITRYVVHATIPETWPYYTIVVDFISVGIDDFTKIMLPFLVCLLYIVYTKEIHKHYTRYS